MEEEQHSPESQIQLEVVVGGLWSHRYQPPSRKGTLAELSSPSHVQLVTLHPKEGIMLSGEDRSGTDVCVSAVGMPWGRRMLKTGTLVQQGNWHGGSESQC